MAATFIQPVLQDFEDVIGQVKNKHTGKTMFDLVLPSGTEAYYQGVLRENDSGRLCVRVFTSIASGKKGARDCGKDAVRCALVWLDKDGWERGLGKTKRVNRSGGQGKTARNIVERALERARDLARVGFPTCPKCSRPMVVRTARSSGKQFYGCVGWKADGSGCCGSRWNVPSEGDKAS